VSDEREQSIARSTRLLDLMTGLADLLPNSAALGDLSELIATAREVGYRDGESNVEADWACALEEAGVTGEDWSPTAIAARLAAAESGRS